MKALFESKLYSKRELRIEYDLDMKHLDPLQSNDLNDWTDNWNSLPKMYSNPLDCLYELIPA